MLQGSRADFSDGTGATEINRHIAISHGRLNRVAQITLPDDVDFRVVLRKLTDCFSHAPSRADEQYTHRKLFHLDGTLTLPSPLARERRRSLVSQDLHGAHDVLVRLSPPRGED